MMTSIFQNQTKNINLHTYKHTSLIKKNRKYLKQKFEEMEKKKMERKELEVGEEYLSVKLSGHNIVAAFKNKDKTQSNQPDYKGDGIAIWIQKKRGPKVVSPTQIVEPIINSITQPLTEPPKV